ncbi:MmcQ/YjbR family DNA-binding protein [Rhizobium mesosinicum]|uniref:MmcQ/YjbR family DNA-binding protein n=1 Tax=Rhizobium mesosinicum TaxID=335017 RepID=A0ABS7GUX7_9HYPH|nr:MmcQ/YjbR family DNA-binding protein [Rhizobium mesosinicum]MBW9053753.1 MmcQ/YjbR family DNA-binding protein [Rhizobium mesosinicum]
MTEGVEGVLARLKRLAKEAGLPGIEESTSYGNPALKVGGKSFVAVKNDETVVFSIPIDHKEHLLAMAPDIYFQTNHYAGWPHLPLRITAIGDDELKQRLIDAWTYRAPKKLMSAYRAQTFSRASAR